MANPALQSTGLHNDDNDDPINATYQKLPSMTGRITSLELLKHHQHSETRTANEQACDEIHELQPKNSSKKKKNTEKSYSKSSKLVSPHQLMQSNYYDQTRFDPEYPSVNHQSESGQIDISVDVYKDCKKKYTPACSSENRSSKDRSTSPPFGETSASIEQSVTQSVGRLLRSNKSEQSHPISIKTNPKSHESATVYGASSADRPQERSLSPSSSSDCSTDDSTASNKRPEDNETTNIPYEELLNDEDEEMIEQPTELATESSTLLNKNVSQTYGTQSTTNERAKYLSNNGYNSHGSSITTKSSSDNSGSIRTNSGSDNDEESDEEHYNNSTASNNPSLISIYSHIHDSSMKSTKNKKSNDIRHTNSTGGNHSLFRRSNPSHPEQIVDKDEPLPQVPRFKQQPDDDPNGNSPPDSNLPPNSSKRSSQQSSINQTNTSSLSTSQYNRNHLEQEEQSSTSSRHNSHPQATRKTKKRKQSYQQDIIRTELIPGHRGDRDVDELVKFIDGNPFPLRPTDTNKPSIASKNNSINEGNSNKSSSRKKSRKSIKSVSATNDDENEDEQINQLPREQQNLSTESHSNTIEIHPTKTTDGETSLSSWFEQTRDQSTEKQDSPSLAIISRSNSEIVSEPFVTVTHRRRVVKERRQDQQPIPRSSCFPPPSSNSSDKRRVPSTQQNGAGRPTISTKSEQPARIIKEENHQPENPPPPPAKSTPPSTTTTSNINPITDQSLEKHQSPPRLSSHSSSSSLSSLLKRQAKPPAVVFLNKSIDFELKDVSFGFDLDAVALDPISTDLDDKPSTIEQEAENVLNTSIFSSNDPATQKSFRKFPQRNPRGPQFYSGSDIRPQQNRTYPTPPIPQPSYIDPRLLLQYHQQRLANYPQHLTYMNLLPPQYLPTQSPYMYPTYTTNEIEAGEEPNRTAPDQIQVVYATPTGQLYFSPATTKKHYNESEAVVTPMSTGYPTPYYYSQQVQHAIPTHPPYFQPISSVPLVIDTKSASNEIDEVDLEDDYKNSRKFSQPKRQQSSADIMSNALQLVYSQQRRNAQTDRFNLDDLTAYLAMKWTDAVDHYAQGDSRILLVDEQ